MTLVHCFTVSHAPIYLDIPVPPVLQAGLFARQRTSLQYLDQIRSALLVTVKDPCAKHGRIEQRGWLRSHVCVEHNRMMLAIAREGVDPYPHTARPIIHKHKLQTRNGFFSAARRCAYSPQRTKSSCSIAFTCGRVFGWSPSQ